MLNFGELNENMAIKIHLRLMSINIPLSKFLLMATVGNAVFPPRVSIDAARILHLQRSDDICHTVQNPKSHFPFQNFIHEVTDEVYIFRFSTSNSSPSV